MAAMDISQPPIPPSVTAQQAPNPVSSFVGGVGAGQQPQFDAMQFVIGRLNQVAEILSDVAKVLAVENPALMPVLQKVAQGGAVLMQEAMKSMPQGGGGMNRLPSQAQMSEPETGAAMISAG